MQGAPPFRADICKNRVKFVATMRLAAYFEPFAAYFEPFEAFLYHRKGNIGKRYARKACVYLTFSPNFVRKTGKFRPYYALFALLGC